MEDVRGGRGPVWPGTAPVISESHAAVYGHRVVLRGSRKNVLRETGLISVAPCGSPPESLFLFSSSPLSNLLASLNIFSRGNQGSKDIHIRGLDLFLVTKNLTEKRYPKAYILRAGHLDTVAMATCTEGRDGRDSCSRASQVTGTAQA